MLVIFLPMLMSFITSYFCPTKRGSGSLVQSRPPPFVFGVVWPTLYLMIGYSWFLTRANDPNEIYGLKVTDILYLLNQVSINLWLYYYNCQNDKKSALYTFLLAIATTFGMLFYSFLYQKFNQWWTFMLLIPYLVWLLFAQQLNFHEVEKSSINMNQ